MQTARLPIKQQNKEVHSDSENEATEHIVNSTSRIIITRVFKKYVVVSWINTLQAQMASLVSWEVLLQKIPENKCQIHDVQWGKWMST